MGHSNQEIDLDGLRDLRREKIRKNVVHLLLPTGRRIILMAEVSMLVARVVDRETKEHRNKPKKYREDEFIVFFHTLCWFVCFVLLVYYLREVFKARLESLWRYIG